LHAVFGVFVNLLFIHISLQNSAREQVPVELKFGCLNAPQNLHVKGVNLGIDARICWAVVASPPEVT
jgi:hypothetical protein